MDNLKCSPYCRLRVKIINVYFQKITYIPPDYPPDNVMIITSAMVVLMKDRAASVLSTDCATKLDTNCLKIRFSSHVKAVNGNSSEGYAQLSHFSVDNMV